MNARAYLSAAGLVVLTMTLTFTGSESSAAQAKGGADRVMLEYRGGVNEPCPVASYPMTRVFPDGTNVAAFTVPPGMVLVVTDLEGIVRETVTWTAGRVAALTAFSTAGSSPRIRAYAPLITEAVFGGVVSMNVHLQSGVVIGPNLNVCVSASVFTQNGFTAAAVSQALLQGYLIAE